MKKTIIIVLVLLLICMTACGNSNSNNETDEPTICKLYIEVEFEENFLFATYDVEIYVDNIRVGLVPHGEHYTVMTEVPAGKNIVSFCKENDQSVYSTREIKIDTDSTIKCTIHSNRHDIEIKSFNVTEGIIGNELTAVDVRGKILEDAVRQLKEIGFTNIKKEGKDGTEIWDDSKWIVAEQSIKSGETVDKNTLFKLICISKDDKYSPEEENKSIDYGEIPEYPKRAFVVAWSNYIALDNWNSEGSKQLPEKFHSYSDTSKKLTDYFIYVDNWGNWKTVDKNTWTVDGIELRFHDEFNAVFNWKFSGEVEYDEKNNSYHITKFRYTDEDEENEHGNFNIKEKCFNIPYSLVEKDRDEKKIDEIDKTDDVSLEQSITAFRKMGEALYPYGFKCHTATGMREHTQFADGSWYIEMEVTIKNEYGEKRDAVASAYINNKTKAVEDFKIN